jgi:ketosteroid isomerase-like protein
MSVRSRADSEIDQLYEAWGEAFQRKNVDAVLGLLTPDYILWPTGAPAISRFPSSETGCDLERLRRYAVI